MTTEEEFYLFSVLLALYCLFQKGVLPYDLYLCV